MHLIQIDQINIHEHFKQPDILNYLLLDGNYRLRADNSSRRGIPKSNRWRIGISAFGYPLDIYITPTGDILVYPQYPSGFFGIYNINIPLIDGTLNTELATRMKVIFEKYLTRQANSLFESASFKTHLTIDMATSSDVTADKPLTITSETRAFLLSEHFKVTTSTTRDNEFGAPQNWFKCTDDGRLFKTSMEWLHNQYDITSPISNFIIKGYDSRGLFIGSATQDLRQPLGEEYASTRSPSVE